MPGYSEGAVAITSTGNSNIIQDQSTDTTIGYSFYVGASDILVTSLGLWDDGVDGFSDSHEVGFGPLDSYTSSVLIPSGIGASLAGEFRYVDLDSPVLLMRDTFYLISARGFGGSSDGFSSSVAGTMLPESSSGIVLDVSVYQSGGGLGIPLIGGTPHIGPSFQYTVVPEPRSFLLGSSALLVLLCRRPTRIKQTEPGPRD
jgi:hypothetical protein